MTTQDPSKITEYHAHVYYDPASRAQAERVRAQVAERFEVFLGRWREEPVGPHPQAMYQVAFAPERFADIVPWLALNRGGLAILVHPNTGDDVADHFDHAIWLGEKLVLDLEFLRQFQSA